MLVILGALHQEIADIRKRMLVEKNSNEGNLRLYKGKYKNKDILLGQTGMGRENTEKAAQFILEHYPAEAMISIGFAGALVENLKVGDVLLNHTLYLMEGETWDTPSGKPPLFSDPGLISKAGKKFSDSPLFSHASSVTVISPASTPEEKLSLGKSFHAQDVDMESYWIARIASAGNIPFINIRAVSDTQKDTLPPFERFISSGKWLRKKATLYFVTHPWQIFKLVFLYRNTRIARKKLAAFMDSFIAEVYRRKEITA